MNFLKLFLRSIALIPGVVQGTEALFGAKSGEQKKTGGGGDCRGGDQHCGCGDDEAHCRCGQVHRGLEHVDRRRGDVSECEPVGEAVVAQAAGAASVEETV